MSEQKYDEKEVQKREEKDEKSSEKSWEEKWRRDPLGSITFAAILIWAGLVFLASNLGFLDRIIKQSSEIPGLGFLEDAARAWPIVLIGAGVILLVEVAVRLLVPVYRRPVIGTIILATILIGIGLGDLINWGIIWAVILIVIGLSVLLRGLQGRSR